MTNQKVALITGGTRRLGLATACQLAQDGYALSLAYRRDDEAAQAAVITLNELTPHVMTIRADCTTLEGAQAVVEKTMARFGRIDVLVNNIGPFVPGEFMQTTADAYHLMVNGNLGTVFHMCQAVIPHMRAQKQGVIINLGSLNAEVARGAPNAALYHALKASVMVLTKSIARSEGAYGIRVNAVNPGIVHLLGASKGIINKIPLRRLGEAEEVAQAISWLVSQNASYVNGAVLNVNGGLFA